MLGTFGVKHQRRCFTAPSPPFLPIMYLIASSSCKAVGKICNTWRVSTPSVNSGTNMSNLWHSGPCYTRFK